MAVEALSTCTSESEFAGEVERLSLEPQGLAALVALLDERHSIYTQQTPQAIVRMRGWLLIALSRRELPAGALPFVLEELDTAIDPYLIAAAALALRAYPHRDPLFANSLAQALRSARSREVAVSLDEYGGLDSTLGATTPMRELILTIGWMGPNGQRLIPELIALKESFAIAPRLLGQLEQTLAAIGGHTAGESCCPALPAKLLGRFSWGHRTAPIRRLLKILCLRIKRA